MFFKVAHCPLERRLVLDSLKCTHTLVLVSQSRSNHVLFNCFIEGYGVPTSIDFIRTETSQMVAAYSTSQCYIYDLETAEAVVTLDSAKTYS